MPSTLVKTLSLTIMIVLGGWLGQKLAIPPGYASPLWPPAGLALAFLIARGRRFWPGVFLGSLLLNVWIGYNVVGAINGTIVLTAALIASGSSLQALLGAKLCERFLGPGVPQLDATASILKFVLLTGPVACLLASLWGTGVLLSMAMIPSSGALFSWWNWWVGDSLGVAIITPLLFTAFARHNPLWRARLIGFGVPVAVMLVGLIALFVNVQQMERSRLQLQFDSLAKPVETVIKSHLETADSWLNPVRALYASSEKIDRDEFSIFAEEMLADFPEIQALEWVPRVRGDELQAFEQQAAGEGYRGFKVKQGRADGSLVPVESRREYFPVYFAEPLAGNEKAIGFDLASEDIRKAAIQQALTTGQMAVSSPIQLVQDATKINSVLMILPVYSNNRPHEPQWVSGLIASLIRLNHFFDTAISGLDTQEIAISVRDQQLPAEQALLYVSNGRDQSKTSSVQPITREIWVGGRAWQLTIAAAPSFFVTHGFELQWLTLLGGLMITALLVILLLSVTGQTSIAEALVSQRTRELDENRSRLQQIINSEPECIKIVDAAGHVLEMNPAGLAMLEADRVEAVVGKPVFDLIAPEYRQAYAAMHQRVIAGQAQMLRYEVIGLKGRRRWLDSQAVPMRLATGEIAHLAVTRDISDLIEHERQVTQLSDQNRGLFMDSPDGYLIARTTDGEILECNHAVEVLFRGTREHIIGKTTLELSPPTQPNGQPSTVWGAALIKRGREEGRLCFEWLHTRFDGKPLNVEVNLSVMSYHDQPAFFCALRDLTDRRLAAELAARLDKISKNVPGFLYQFQRWPDGRSAFPYASGGIRQIYGVEPAEVQEDATPVFACLHPDDFERVIQRIEESAATLTTWQDEFRVRLANGEVRWTQGASTPEPMADGSVLWHGYISDITERKFIEEQIRASEQRFRLFVENTPIPIALFDRQMHYLAASREWLSQLNITDAAIGRCHYDVHPDLPPAWIQVHRRCLAGEILEDSNSRWERADGSVIWCHWIVRPWHGLDGAIQGIVISFMDISERVKVEEALRLSQETLQRAQAVARIGSWAMDSNTEQFTISSETARLFDLGDNGTTTFDAWFARVHPDDQRQVETAWRAALRGSPYDMTYRILVRDDILWIRALAELTFDEDGSVLAAVGTVQDITESKRYEAQLAESERRFRSMADAAPVLIWLSGNDKLCTWFNKGWLDFTGRAMAQEVGNGWLAGVHPEDCERCSGLYVSAFDRREAFVMDYRLRRFDGEYRWIRDCGVPRFDENREFEGYIGSCIDITDQKDLEHGLIAAKETAEAASRAKSAFLSNMSHEIRTPLNAIIGMSYSLGLSDLTADQREQLGTIESASRSLLAQINDILDLSKIEAGEFALETVRFSLPQLMADLDTLFGPAMRQKGLAFKLPSDWQAYPAQLLGDVQKLRQILVNLIGNALKFTARGQVELGLAVVDRNDDRITLGFSVADTGIGIAPDVVPRLFQPFIQAEVSTNRKYGGSGLGLSLVRQLSEHMGGHVAVDSTLGQGSVFRLQLPFGIASPAVTGSQRPLKLLAVVNDPIDQQDLVTMSRQFGWALDVVADIQRLVERVANDLNSQRPIDGVLLDGDGLAMNGLDALAALDRRFGRHRLPVLMIATAGDCQTLGQQLESASIRPDALINKPFNASLLFNQVNHAVLARLAIAEAAGLHFADSNTEHSTGLPNLRVLVVDDSEMNLKVCQRLLSHQGADATLCQSGPEAIRQVMANRNGFDVVLMDVQMPDMDGCEATRQLRQFLQGQRLPIVALTAGATVTEQEQAMNAGMDAFLTKPIIPAQLVATLRELVEPTRDRPLPLLTDPLPVGSLAAVGEASWPVIDGLDVPRVRALLDDDFELFQILVSGFLNDAAPPMLQARQVLIDDQQRAAAILHRLRGQCGNIGAMALFDALGELESAAYAQQLTAEQLAEGQRQLAVLVENLTIWRRSPSAAQPIVSGTMAATEPPLVNRDLSELKDQLAQQNMAALASFASLADAIKAELGSEIYAKLESAIRQLDFASAVTLLNSLSDEQHPSKGA